MEALKPHDLTNLPYEITSQIVACLDAQSLKALRLAFVHPRVSAATGKFLFQSKLKFRLGSIFFGIIRIRRLLSYLDEFESQASHWDDAVPLPPPPLAGLHSFTLDTRDTYHFVEANLRHFEGTHRANRDVPEAPSDGNPELHTLLLELLSRVIKSSPGLRVVKWTSSSCVRTSLHTDISRLLSDQSAVQMYALEVSFDLLTDIPDGFFAPLSNISSFKLMEPQDGRCKGVTLSQPTLDGIEGLLRRSKELKAITLQLLSCRIKLGASSRLWKLFANAQSLECLDINFNNNLEQRVDWDLAKRLKALRVAPRRLIDLGVPTWPESQAPTVVSNLEPFIAQPSNPRISRFQIDQGAYLSQVVLSTSNDSWADQELAISFWRDVVTNNASTLKDLCLTKGKMQYSCWSWADAPNNLAQAALKQCTVLEHLKIAFDSSVGNFVENVATFCPKLHAICVNVGAHVNYHGMALELKDWRSTKPTWQGRKLKIWTTHHPRSRGKFDDYFQDGFLDHRWFDKVVQTWLMDGNRDSRGQVYTFDRLYDRYLSDEEMVEEKLMFNLYSTT
ncbi:hypothetical protein DRE_04146 [Drechslerella stenobrocha 248]|uniref:F-box domain-containing protein n=1 Tax=Drechslerella stenobrocha 248 TaxID=1043628 RepID=W7HTG1_9PEZI|nr:hypothetical protein DRE_04146 [Drechslerella stenobrocha 248]